jgi:nucleoredoxin
MNFSELGNDFIDSSGKSITREAALAGKSGVALYFSAHWCPPCKQFTPILAELYRKSYKAKGLEVIFVSSDRDIAAFSQYLGEMPWLAIPFSDRNIKARLSEKFGISGIPALIVFDSLGNLVTSQGREAAMGDKSGERCFGLKPSKAVFSGKSSTLGGSTSTSTHIGTIPHVDLDPNTLHSKIQFRFPDGSKLVQVFNETDTVMHLTAFVTKLLGENQVSLSTGYPLKTLDDMALTLKKADLFNAVVNVVIV